MDVNRPQWRKASRSSNNGGDCVELAAFADSVALRDSKDPDGPKLRLVRSDFRGFVTAVKNL
ncbi:DUF397 domain-containing protein [Actinomadura sp. 9N407]|uniref:DUF397 domain-containing protein n=1 Tax=Actinomadura sp. 9N407 TaxID=3375154 RepID=UPI0037A09A64